MDKPLLIKLPKIEDSRGSLTFIESQNHVPFEIKQCYWMYDVPEGVTQKGNAFIEQDELIVALYGSFDVVCDNGSEQEVFHLDKSYFGLHVPKMFWRNMENFSTNSVVLVLASIKFNKKYFINGY